MQCLLFICLIFFRSERGNAKNNTVASVSEYLGISRSSLYKALRGDTVLSLDNIYALSVYLGISINEMIIAVTR